MMTTKVNNTEVKVIVYDFRLKFIIVATVWTFLQGI